MDGGSKGREGGRKRLCETAREREWRQGGKVEGGFIIVIFIQSEPYIGITPGTERARKG